MDTSTADPLVGTVLGDRYRLDALIARGGMATVYAGFDTRLDRAVAVKVMHGSLAADEAFVERFRREAKSAARLSHPSVVAIYDQGEDAGRVYLVMEHVGGRTLRDLLRDAPLDPAEALDIADGVLTALAAAHAAGLVHRDVKPENVLIAADGRVKVADFGLARAVEASQYSVADGTLLGTVAYLAPEQVTSGAADPRADLYALGVVLFEMATGTVPFTGDTPLAVAYAHVNEDVPDPATVDASVPRGVADVIRAATRRSVDERYPDAEAMLSAVRRARSALGARETSVIRLDEAPTLVTKLPPVVPPPGPAKTAKQKKPRRKRPWLVFLAISAAVLLISGVAGWYLASESDATDTPALVGLTRITAETELRDAGLTVRYGTPVNDDDVPKDSVVSQDPSPGSPLERGDVVTLTLSLGVKMVRVPVLAGKTLTEATKLLTDADLARGDVRRRYDEEVDKDVVIGASHSAGTSLRHGSKVALVVSDGPAPVTVPDVRLEKLKDARAKLTGAGLEVKVVEAFNDNVEKDRVISQTPAATTSVPRGSTVTLTVSKGPELITVPDVRGDRIEDARGELEELGLRVRLQRVSHGRGRVVIDQDPVPGSRVRRDSVVTIYAL